MKFVRLRAAILPEAAVELEWSPGAASDPMRTLHIDIPFRQICGRVIIRAITGSTLMDKN